MRPKRERNRCTVVLTEGKLAETLEFLLWEGLPVLNAPKRERIVIGWSEFSGPYILVDQDAQLDQLEGPEGQGEEGKGSSSLSLSPPQPSL